MRHQLIAFCLLFAGICGLAAADCICPAYPCKDCQCPGSPGGRCPGGTCPGGKCPTGYGDVGASVGGFTTPGGKDAACPLPREFHLQNRGGSDGAGLCVFCSIQHAAQWASVPELEDFFRWMWNKPGGGYPSKVDKMIAQKCREQNKPVPAYIQVEGKDLSPLILASKTGRMSSITYGWSPTGRYNGRRIPHMVSLVHADGEWFGILDNNYPGTIEWMNQSEFKKSYFEGGNGNGWAVILLEPGPPPPPYTPKQEPIVMLPTLLTVAALSVGQWSGGRCAPASGGWSAAPQVESYRWIEADAEQVALYRGSMQVGTYVLSEGVFYRLAPGVQGAGRWSVAECPIAAPPQAQGRAKVQRQPVVTTEEDKGLFGVIQAGISDNKYSLKGREITRKQCLEAIEGGELTDDSGLMWLTVVGDEALRAKVKGDLAGPTLAAFRGKIKAKYYDPSHWAVKDVGFRPGIHIEAGDGASLWRQEDYQHGAAGLFAALEWCDRKTRPDYDPNKDPGPGAPWRRPEPPKPAPDKQPDAPAPAPSDNAASIPAGLCGGCAGLIVAALAFFFARKKHES